MSLSDLARTRFAYSPLIECAESIYMLSSGRINPIHEGWYEQVRDRLHATDLELLRAVVPATGWIAAFYLYWATSPATTIDGQLSMLASVPVEVLREKIVRVWAGRPVPPAAAALFTPAGPRRLADALAQYWRVAIEPYWPAIRGVLDDDVAHRAGCVTKAGLDGLLGGLHPQVNLDGEVMRIGEKGFDDRTDGAVDGAGMSLVPSVFTWPEVIFTTEPGGPARLIYPARGVGKLWGAATSSETDEAALGALLGRSRAQILVALATPRTTTEVAMLLGKTTASVSQHLSVLRRSAMATCWRSGRRVLYLRTDLATSIVQANSRAAPIA
jgi:hypothetical protein